MNQASLNIDINFFISELDYRISDFDIIRRENYNTIEEFFEYFETNYDFRGINIQNSMQKFQQLDRFMSWNNFKIEQRSYFNSLNMTDKRFYIQEFYRHYNLIYSNENPNKCFKYLCKEIFNLYSEAKRFLTDFIGTYVEDQFEKLEDLQNIIQRYNLISLNEVPNTVSECRDLIKRNLFVNIYDFAAGNNKKFRSLQELRYYTIKNELFYPLKEAKETFAFKVLLRRFF